MPQCRRTVVHIYSMSHFVQYQRQHGFVPTVMNHIALTRITGSLVFKENSATMSILCVALLILDYLSKFCFQRENKKV